MIVDLLRNKHLSHFYCLEVHRFTQMSQILSIYLSLSVKICGLFL
jgi:hypothetical protein